MGFWPTAETHCRFVMFRSGVLKRFHLTPPAAPDMTPGMGESSPAYHP